MITQLLIFFGMLIAGLLFGTWLVTGKVIDTFLAPIHVIFVYPIYKKEIIKRNQTEMNQEISNTIGLLLDKKSLSILAKKNNDSVFEVKKRLKRIQSDAKNNVVFSYDDSKKQLRHAGYLSIMRLYSAMLLQIKLGKIKLFKNKNKHIERDINNSNIGLDEVSSQGLIKRKIYRHSGLLLS